MVVSWKPRAHLQWMALIIIIIMVGSDYEGKTSGSRVSGREAATNVPRRGFSRQRRPYSFAEAMIIDCYEMKCKIGQMRIYQRLEETVY